MTAFSMKKFQEEQERSLRKVIGKRQLQFLGHVMRSQGMENLVLTGKILLRLGEVEIDKGRCT